MANEFSLSLMININNNKNSSILFLAILLLFTILFYANKIIINHNNLKSALMSGQRSPFINFP